MARFFYYFFISLVIGSFVVQSSLAEKQNSMPIANDNTVILLGTEKLLKFDLIREFLQLAFSKLSWNETSPHYAELFDDFLSRYKNPDYNALKKTLPPENQWLGEYYYREYGLPKDNTINKWVNAITVGVDWPHSPINERREFSTAEKDYITIEKHVTRLIPQLSLAVGLPIRFVTPTPEEREAAIRIVPVEWDRTERGTPNSIHQRWSIWSGESGFWGAVQFEDKKNDGYILPHADNSIGMTICKINMLNNSETIRKDIASCLYRSLGLPAAQLSGPDFSQRDLFLARLLYCPALLPGMDKNKALDVLMNNPKCFSHKQ